MVFWGWAAIYLIFHCSTCNCLFSTKEDTLTYLNLCCRAEEQVDERRMRGSLTPPRVSPPRHLRRRRERSRSRWRDGAPSSALKKNWDGLDLYLITACFFLICSPKKLIRDQKFGDSKSEFWVQNHKLGIQNQKMSDSKSEIYNAQSKFGD